VYKRIVVPLDGSSLAEQVLPYACLLAEALHSRLDLLRVFAPVSAEMVAASHGLYLNNLSEALRDQALVLADSPAQTKRVRGRLL